METDELIVHNLINDESYTRKVIPFLLSEYFLDKKIRIIFELINEFFIEYNTKPSYASLRIDTESYEGMDQDTYESILKFLSLSEGTNESVDFNWLVDTTEEFCQERALSIALFTAIEISEDDNEKSSLTKTAIPEILQKALSVSFDTNIGHDFIENAIERYNFIHDDVEHIPFDIDILNKITKNGVTRKTLNVLMAATGGFKSGTLCHFAAQYFLAGLNVVYITMEMSEEKIGERIDCNLLDVTFDSMAEMSRVVYEKKIERIKERSPGKLIIKEYPTSSAHAGHFRFLLRELRTKKNFVPDIVIVDYLNICASSRIKSSENSYNYVKSIAEELRGLAVEFNVPLWTATQTNRDGWDKSDLSLSNTSESAGLPATADLFLGVIGGEDMDMAGQLAFKQLKNRYNDVNYYRKFTVGCNKAKMKLFDLDIEQNPQPPPPGANQADISNMRKSKTEKFSSFKV